MVLCVGDTSFLDYKNIVAKKEDYGPIGKAGNGLILHTALAIEPMNGQSIGLLWQKLWHREPKQKPPKQETPTQKKQRQAAARKAARNRPFEYKESYRWVEALTTVESLVSKHTRVVHVFDREGDITEVFDQPFGQGRRQRAEGRRMHVTFYTCDTSVLCKAATIRVQSKHQIFDLVVFNQWGLEPPLYCLIPSAFCLLPSAFLFDKVRQLQHTGVLIRAAHNRSLDSHSQRLWSKLEAQPINFEQEIELPQTSKRSKREAKLAVRFCPVNLRTPYRFDNRDPLRVYAVYATEVDCPEGEAPVEWMLLTTEAIADSQMASTVLRWYSYRWRVEEYHKILKSGCQVERYRLAADGMKALLGFLSVIAVELLHLTYLHRTQPTTDAIEILNPLQLQVLKAKSPKLPNILTVSWAVEAIARLGGYLEHRHKTPIGIQVLWRGWLKLHDLCEGWQLARET